MSMKVYMYLAFGMRKTVVGQVTTQKEAGILKKKGLWNFLIRMEPWISTKILELELMEELLEGFHKKACAYIHEVIMVKVDFTLIFSMTYHTMNLIYCY